MTIRFLTLGCKLNFAESSHIGRLLYAQGHTRARQGEPADICIINTCSVTDTADQKDRQAIHRLRRENPNAILIVTGCYAQLQPETISNMPEVDYVLGQDEKFSIAELLKRIDEQVKVQASAIRECDAYHSAWSKDDRTRCFLKVQDGCNYFCTYCTIPLARGKSRNGSIATIVEQAREAIVSGSKEIVLTGVNIGDFGRSTGECFIDLLRTLDTIETTSADEKTEPVDYRIRISSCEPNLLTDEIIDFVAHSQHFAPHFHIPLQSGSDTMLKLMHRHYDTSLFRERIEHIRSVMPKAFIGVDCMVGVRGETEECWNEYVHFVESLPVSQLHVFTYSERANTRMLEMDLCVVPMKERHRRSQLLHAISEQKLQDFYAAHRGEQAVVLWEAKNDKGTMYGFTENYIRVSCPYDKRKINCFERITI